MTVKYRRLAEGETILEGDEFDNCRDGWRDDAVWVKATDIGGKAPDPCYASHRQYRRRIRE